MSLIFTCLRLYCPALSADTGHSDSCAAANRGASGDGLRPAGADTPGSGVTAALCQCHDRVTAYQSACYNQDLFCFFFPWPISVLFGSSHSLPACLTAAWTACSSAQCVLSQPQYFTCALTPGKWPGATVCLDCLFPSCKSKFYKSDILPDEYDIILKRSSACVAASRATTWGLTLNYMDPQSMAVTSHHLALQYIRCHRMAGVPFPLASLYGTTAATGFQLSIVVIHLFLDDTWTISSCQVLYVNVN